MFLLAGCGSVTSSNGIEQTQHIEQTTEQAKENQYTLKRFRLNVFSIMNVQKSPVRTHGALTLFLRLNNFILYLCFS